MALQRLLEGHIPAVGTASEDARRAGYFAEFAAMLLGACNRATLLDWADDLRAALEREHGPAKHWPVVAAVMGGRPREPTLDRLAARWRIGPPLDRARFLSEQPTLKQPLVRAKQL